MPKYDEDDYLDLKNGLRIDRNCLDEEAIRQPNDFFHASEGYVKAVARRDHKKLDLEVTIAELDKDVRDAMTAEGEKITEAQVKAQINREQDHQRAYKGYLEACLIADKWEALRNAYRQRADMIRNLITLHQTGYFGEVTGAAERRSARERFDERRGV